MKTIGLIGGMSWESTLGYYREINQRMNAALGGLHSARIVLYSVDFEPIEERQRRGDWAGAAEILVAAARSVEAAGADFVLICTNTMHKVATEIEESIAIPLLHIADATAERLVADGVTKVGLLGTAFTMEQAFYKARLTDAHGLEVVVPNEADRRRVHAIIFNELCRGEIRPASRREYLRIVDDLSASGAEAVVLGCTEIGMLIDQAHTDVPLYDTTALHAAKAVEWALAYQPGRGVDVNESAVVLDTNVFVAAGFNPNSSSAAILDAVRHKRLRLVWNDATRGEIEHTLRQIPPVRIEDVSGLFLDKNRFDGATHPERFNQVPGPADRKFAALAHAAGAVLVSNDSDLLDATRKKELTVVTPPDFAKRLDG